MLLPSVLHTKGITQHCAFRRSVIFHLDTVYRTVLVDRQAGGQAGRQVLQHSQRYL